MWGFRLLRSPPLLLLLPQIRVGVAAFRAQAGTMNLGGTCGARSSPAAEGRRQQCLQLSTVPGADPQRSNELLLLATAATGKGAEWRGLSEDLAKEEPQLPPQHHVLYFPGDVQHPDSGKTVRAIKKKEVKAKPWKYIDLQMFKKQKFNLKLK
ncbi:mitochondrial protein C2orf69 homolog isoform X2 [Manis pentadactyla]|uniref:mitochondrial protein C2orf69 homolog isoform X2 n=1 Tax=Manis pentadactyla TaxID=143292 RepID=UPI00255C70D9|nr:mitochondrial protein C2orf69 homolog isoform X2 [Manis pentadactyla]XP_057359798.1 mitochondrial protein C2orf69 homolog isoform X2 [Manis pentadactyla]XP_057359799.1 mitochondrial protein C2orf69 homolog isoform X2 [Manis pentadactyla]